MNLNIGVIGLGFVGKAVDYGFQKNVIKYHVDPLLDTTISSMYDSFVPDIIFVAVPTPMGSDGVIDSSIIESVFTELASYEYQPIVVIKSTITPSVIQKLKSIYNRIIFNPEFLTERNANWDFINADMLVIGGTNQEDMDFVKSVYDNHSECKQCPVYFVELETAAMIKYTLNCFLASKVLFFNQLNQVFEKSGISTDWNTFTKIVSTDSRIGTSHMSIPGPDGRKGFGGACFTKDTMAMIRYADDIGVDFSQLKETVKANQIIRNQYNELDEREKAQNVKFNIII